MATVKRIRYESYDRLRVHLADFIAAYNFARRLKTLGGLTPYEYIARNWTSEPDWFIVNPIHQMPGPNRNRSMEKMTTIGLDLAKSVFQVHGITEEGRVTVRQALRRSQVLDFFRSLVPCLVGLEACTSAHHWANAIAEFGHTVRMMPAAYVKAYVKRNKTDAADAEAICEAVTRPTLRFVPIKTPDEQAACMVLKTRELFVRQRTQQAPGPGSSSPIFATSPGVSQDTAIPHKVLRRALRGIR